MQSQRTARSDESWLPPRGVTRLVSSIICKDNGQRNSSWHISFGQALMRIGDQVCPIDGSELVCQRLHCSRKGKFDVASYYCPVCDAGFVCWADPACDKPPVFVWRTEGHSLRLTPAYAKRSVDYRRHDRMAETNMLHDVDVFLRCRSTNPRRCPNDGGIIPAVAELPYVGQAVVACTWCPHCGEVFAHLCDPHYGWRPFVSFSYGRDGYSVRRVYREGADIQLIREKLTAVPCPPSDFTAVGG